MAARTRKARHDDFTRERIRTTQLVNRLTDHALGALGEHPMTPSQVAAAVALLRKTLPDLKHVEVTGPGGAPLQHDIADLRARNLELVESVAGGAAGPPAGAAAAAGAGDAEPARDGGIPVGLAGMVGEG